MSWSLQNLYIKVSWFRNVLLVASILPKTNKNNSTWGIIHSIEVDFFALNFGRIEDTINVLSKLTDLYKCSILNRYILVILWCLKYQGAYWNLYLSWLLLISSQLNNLYYTWRLIYISSKISPHSLNFHQTWRWWDGIQATFLNLLYFISDVL